MTKTKTKTKKSRSFSEKVKAQKRKAEAKSRQAARQSRLRTSLQLPVLDPDLVARLGGKRRAASVAEIAQQIALFVGVDDAVKRSHRYYHRALAKVYETWLELLTWEEADQAELLEALNALTEQKTTKGDGLHILLRSMIDYGGVVDESAPAEERRKVSQIAVQRAGRDAAALKFAARQKTPSDRLAAFIAEYPGGVDRMARDEAQQRKGKVRSVPAPVRPGVNLIWPKGLEEAVLDAFEDSQGVSIFLCPGAQAGSFEVAVAHNVNRSAENWCERVKRKHDLDPLEPVSV